MTEDEDNTKEEGEETLIPEEEKEEDEGTYLEDIAEEREADVDPATGIFEMRMRGQDKRVSLEVIDEKVM